MKIQGTHCCVILWILRSLSSLSSSLSFLFYICFIYNILGFQLYLARGIGKSISIPSSQKWKVCFKYLVTEITSKCQLHWIHLNIIVFVYFFHLFVYLFLGLNTYRLILLTEIIKNSNEKYKTKTQNQLSGIHINLQLSLDNTGICLITNF